MRTITAVSYRLSFLLLLLLSLNATLNGQQTTANQIRETLASSNCANVEETQLKVCKFDYLSNLPLPSSLLSRPPSRSLRRVRRKFFAHLKEDCWAT